jgi:GNAT superfamily N-acetyltransferase
MPLWFGRPSDTRRRHAEEQAVPDWVIERLADRHNRSDFDCGKPSLSEWIKRYAGQNETRDVARTYVAVRPNDSRVFGYYCLSTCHINYGVLPKSRAKKLSPRLPVPMALIGKLAVDRGIQGQGLGTVLLLDALVRTLHLADQIGIHAVVVDAIDEQARGFYLKYGFETLLDDPLHLFIAMKVVRQLNTLPPTE